MMSPERFRQVRNLFEAVLEKHPEERESFLRASEVEPPILAEVERLLASHHRRVTFLDGKLTATDDLRTDPSRMEGRRLGAFQIMREIGRGGMSTVYLAQRADGLFAQKVAIKVIHPELATDEFVRRFVQEREILASLEHANIARLYDGGTTEEGWPYLVMEYLDAKPIDTWCDERRLTVSDRLQLFGQVCEAVQYAHRHRIIHRDLKPSNILVTAEGVVKLLDFGIAKMLRSPPEGDALPLTRAGLRLLTPEYASPEQIRGEATSPLTDVYSLGVVLFELVTGRRPQRMPSRIFHEIARVVCEEPVRLPSATAVEVEVRVTATGETVTVEPGQLSGAREGSAVELQRRLAGAVDSILLRALAKHPRERYRTVENLRQDIEAHLDGRRIEAPSWVNAQAMLRRVHTLRIPILFGAAVAVATGTGALQLDAAAVVYFGTATILMAFWTIAADRKLGAAAHDAVCGQWPGFAFLLLMGASFVFHIWGYDSPPRTIWVLRILIGSCSLLVTVLLLRWTLRRRFSGGLLARGRRFGFRHLGLVLWLIAGFLPFSVSVQFVGEAATLRTHPKTGDISVDLAYFALAGLLGVYQVAARRNWELRERGVFVGGRYLPWVRMESFRWETPGEVTIQVRGLVTIRPKAVLRIAPERREEIDAYLGRQLSEWPS